MKSLKDLMESYRSGTITVEQLKEGLKDYGDQTMKALQEHGVHVPTTPETATKQILAGAMLHDMYLSKINGHRGQQKAKERLEGWLAKDMAESGTPGYLVATEYSRELFELIQGASVILPDCTTYSMDAAVRKVPGVTSGMSVGWHSEAQDIDLSEPTLNEITLTAFRCDAYSVSSNELLEDSMMDVSSMLTRLFGSASAQSVDSSLFGGNSSTSFSGIYASNCAAYSTTFGSGSTAFSEILFTDLVRARAKVPSWIRALGRERFYMHESVAEYLSVEKNSQGDFRWPLFGSGAMGMRGVPIVESTNCPSVSGAAKACGVYAIPKCLVIGDRTQFSILVDPYTLATKNQTRLIFISRLAMAMGDTRGFSRIVTHA